LHKKKLVEFVKQRKSTLLGVGPMSKNCVDAAIEIANDFDIPLMLIASRRQIDSFEHGGGYVNNWVTTQFSEYVKKNDIRNNIILSRDHGGPWQNSKEVERNLDLRSAMESSKQSFLIDIKSGFNIIHIDPSIDIHEKPSIDQIMDRLIELYEYCWIQSQRIGNDILFEIGTEEQTGAVNSPDEFENLLSKFCSYCIKENLPKPTFVVAQTGTKVMEIKNIGTFDSPFRVANELPAEIQVPKMIEICEKHGVMLKQHNTDYLSDESLQWHPRLGIHAANVAPEFGVTETLALIKILDTHNLSEISEKFIDLSFLSYKWKKWMLPNSQYDKKYKAIISGHYILSTPECINLLDDAKQTLKMKKINLDFYLKEEVKKSILRYARFFKLINY
jgi:hypothetical protein